MRNMRNYDATPLMAILRGDDTAVDEEKPESVDCGWSPMGNDFEEERRCVVGEYDHTEETGHALGNHYHLGYFRCMTCHYYTGNQSFRECPNPNHDLDALMLKHTELEPPPTGPGVRATDNDLVVRR